MRVLAEMAQVFELTPEAPSEISVRSRAPLWESLQIFGGVHLTKLYANRPTLVYTLVLPATVSKSGFHKTMRAYLRCDRAQASRSIGVFDECKGRRTGPYDLG